jgi:hypothetical protein
MFSDLVEWIKTTGNNWSWLANILQIVSVIWVLISFSQAKYAYNRRRKLLELQPSEGAVAVAIGVGTDIEASVRSFLEEHFGSSEGKSKVPLIKSYYRKGFIRATDFSSILIGIRDDMDELRRSGDIRELHLFYGGPYAIAVGIGAIVDNWIPVHVHMYNQKESKYELAYILSAELIKG